MADVTEDFRAVIKALIRASVFDGHTIPVPCENHSDECSAAELDAPCCCSPVMLTKTQLDLYDSCVLDVVEEQLTSGLNIAEYLYSYIKEQGCCRIPKGRMVSPELLKWTGRTRTYELVCKDDELVAD